jgi:hypothetical protein
MQLMALLAQNLYIPDRSQSSLSERILGVNIKIGPRHS